MSFQVIRKVLFRGEVRERTLEVPGDTLRIGRGVSNELQLEDLSVSLNHAEIRLDEQGRFILRDISQAQATYVNRGPVEAAVLRHGDVVRIQHYLLSVSQSNSSGPLVLTVEEAPKAQVEPSLALMPRLQLSKGRWTKWRIAGVLVLLVLAGSILVVVLGQRKVFMPGAVSVKHSKFADQCEVCHTSMKPVWSFVDNTSCQTCHRSDILSPTHFKQEVALSLPPLCASCHLEHKGQKELRDVPDVKCVQCHGDLKAKDQQVPGIAAVHSFAGDHPEFAVSRSRRDRAAPLLRVRLSDKTQLKDDGRLQLNHAFHLGLEKDYLETRGLMPLTCTECHRADDEGRNMQPITFQRDCMRCHAADLEFDPLLPGRGVTHGRELEAVRQQLDEVYSGVYLQSYPEEAKKPERGRWIPGRQIPGQPQTAHERYVVDRRAEAERSLFSTRRIVKCMKCHSLEPSALSQGTAASEMGQVLSQGVAKEKPKAQASPLDSSETSFQTDGDKRELDLKRVGVGGENDRSRTSQLAPQNMGAEKIQSTVSSGANVTFDKFAISMLPGPGLFRIARVNVTSRWLPYSRFNHGSHSSLRQIKDRGKGNWCVGCHENAPASRKTEDVLLPSIDLCRTCHMESGGAQASCKSCHDFHVPKLPLPPSFVPDGEKLKSVSP